MLAWSPSEGLHHGGRRPVKTSGVYFGSDKTFLPSVKLENIYTGASLNILVAQNSKLIRPSHKMFRFPSPDRPIFLEK